MKFLKYKFFYAAFMIFFSLFYTTILCAEEDKSKIDLSLGVSSFYSSYYSESNYVIIPNCSIFASGEYVKCGFIYTGFLHSSVYDYESKRNRVDLSDAAIFLEGFDLNGFKVKGIANYSWGEEDFSSLSGLLGLGYNSGTWKLSGAYKKAKSDYSSMGENISYLLSSFEGELVIALFKNFDVTGEGRRDSYSYEKSDYTFSSNYLKLGIEVKTGIVKFLFGAGYGYDSDDYRFPGADAGISISSSENVNISICYSYYYFVSPRSNNPDEVYTPISIVSVAGLNYPFRERTKSGKSFHYNRLGLSAVFTF